MTQIACPSCGAPVQFLSPVSIFSVCKYCSQMLVRRDLDIQMIGKTAVLPVDSSVLQVGTTGRSERGRFTIVGRLLQKWSDGSWNEWFLLFDDGSHAWLGEAQGFYSLSFETQGLIPPSQESLKVGQTVVLKGIRYEVDDLKSVSCDGSEGELPFRAVKGRASKSIDLTGPEALYGCVEYSDDGARVSLGKYLDFEQFSFENLRKIDGW